VLRRARIAGVLAAGLLLTPAFAQRKNPAPQLHSAQKQQPQPERHEQRQQEKEARKEERAAQRHSGDWLRRYKGLPPDEQRKALETILNSRNSRRSGRHSYRRGWSIFPVCLRSSRIAC